ncbi:hypothetical protein ACOSQ4_014147 [Xanthoceras sorbifolium]
MSTYHFSLLLSPVVSVWDCIVRKMSKQDLSFEGVAIAEAVALHLPVTILIIHARILGRSDRSTGGFIPPDCRGSTSVDTIVLNVMLKSDESWFNVLKQ